MFDPIKEKWLHSSGNPSLIFPNPNPKAITGPTIATIMLNIKIITKDFLVIFFSCILTLSQKFHRGNK